MITERRERARKAVMQAKAGDDLRATRVNMSEAFGFTHFDSPMHCWAHTKAEFRSLIKADREQAEIVLEIIKGDLHPDCVKLISKMICE